MSEDVLQKWKAERKEHGIWTSGHSIAAEMADELTALRAELARVQARANASVKHNRQLQQQLEHRTLVCGEKEKQLREAEAEIDRLVKEQAHNPAEIRLEAVTTALVALPIGDLRCEVTLNRCHQWGCANDGATVMPKDWRCSTCKVYWFIAALLKDNCEICHGSRGGVRGNENVVDGKRMCDYCHSDWLKRSER